MFLYLFLLVLATTMSHTMKLPFSTTSLSCIDQSQCMDVVSEYNPCSNMYTICFDWTLCEYTSFQKICNANVAGFTTCMSKWGTGTCLNYVNAFYKNICVTVAPESNVFIALPGCTLNQYYETILSDASLLSKCIDNDNNDAAHLYKYGNFHDCMYHDRFCLWNIQVPMKPDIKCLKTCTHNEYTVYMSDGTVLCLPLSVGLGVKTV